MLKIKLTQDLPIDAKHGCTEGAEFTVTKTKGRRTSDTLFYFNDHNGVECAAYGRELEIIEGSKDDAPNERGESQLGKW